MGDETILEKRRDWETITHALNHVWMAISRLDAKRRSRLYSLTSDIIDPKIASDLTRISTCEQGGCDKKDNVLSQFVRIRIPYTCRWHDGTAEGSNAHTITWSCCGGKIPLSASRNKIPPLRGYGFDPLSQGDRSLSIACADDGEEHRKKNGGRPCRLTAHCLRWVPNNGRTPNADAAIGIPYLLWLREVTEGGGGFDGGIDLMRLHLDRFSSGLFYTLRELIFYPNREAFDASLRGRWKDDGSTPDGKESVARLLGRNDANERYVFQRTLETQEETIHYVMDTSPVSHRQNRYDDDDSDVEAVFSVTSPGGRELDARYAVMYFFASSPSSFLS